MLDADQPETPLVRRRDGHVLWLTIDRPAVRNALNDTVVEALTDALASAPDDPGIRAIVLTGSGDRVFCAGADLKPDSDIFHYDMSRPRSTYADLLRSGIDCPVPIVARVNGHALAGGLGLLAMCDMVVAADHARFGLPEVKVGMFPMMAGAVLRPLLPPRLFKELALTGEPIDAQRAAEAGLVNYAVPSADLDEKVGWLLGRITDKSPTGIRRGKLALRTTLDMSLDEAIVHMAMELMTLGMTEDAAEGMRAFNEKRPPHWTGR